VVASGPPPSAKCAHLDRLTPATWDTAGRRITASFLYNATRSLLEEAGFSYSRPKGMNH